MLPGIRSETRGAVMRVCYVSRAVEHGNRSARGDTFVVTRLLSAEGSGP